MGCKNCGLSCAKSLFCAILFSVTGIRLDAVIALRGGAVELAEVNGSLEQYRQQWLTLLNKPYLPSLLQGIHPQFKPSFLEDFPANGKTTLNDGLSGTTDYSYNWLLFDSKDVEITFPFSNERMASQIQLNFLLDPAHYLFLPDEIAVETSNDNILREHRDI
ncbi:hypothetical protein [Sphingobacterium sp.]|uniref:hypothetical protein n=1 Tax=Sphingobacterium sp. TaxID=341027 RepID=UPI0028A17BA2|nr:hypothetical protein [Sphingobacterium sp.]